MVNITGGALASKVKGKLITQPVHSTPVIIDVELAVVDLVRSTIHLTSLTFGSHTRWSILQEEPWPVRSKESL